MNFPDNYIFVLCLSLGHLVKNCTCDEGIERTGVHFYALNPSQNMGG